MTRRVFGAVVLLLALTVGLSVQHGRAAPSGTAGGMQRFGIIPGESQVSYRVSEVLPNQNNRPRVAVGTTPAVQGWILIDRVNPRNSRIGPITVDISQFKSDFALRDTFIRNQWLESVRYPIAEFTTRFIEGLPDAYTDGRDIALQIRGDLKIHDTTRPATFATTIKLEGNTLSGQATTQIRMTDFGFDPPSILGVLRAENDAQLELRLVARASQ